MQAYGQTGFIPQQPPTSVQIIQQPSQSTQPNNVERPGFAHRVTAGLGICEITLGFLALVLGSVIIVNASGLYFVGSPIWCGVLMILTGVFGIMSAYFKTTCLIVTSMVLSIISVSLSPSLVGLASASMNWADDCDYIWQPRYGHYSYICSPDKDMQGVHATLIALPVIYVIIAIINSAFCCRAVCCGTSSRQTNTVPVVYYLPQQQLMPNTQPGMVYNQTIQPGTQPMMMYNQTLQPGTSIQPMMAYSQTSQPGQVTAPMYPRTTSPPPGNEHQAGI
ncbi:uncharacterized protein LOC144447478 isoform X1 [Glandiceps talaboti]